MHDSGGQLTFFFHQLINFRCAVHEVFIDKVVVISDNVINEVVDVGVVFVRSCDREAVGDVFLVDGELELQTFD